MRPAPFELIRPDSLAHALDAINAGAVPLAGGQTLIQNLRLRRQEPETLLDVLSLDCLKNNIELIGDSLVVGAKVTHHQLAKSELVAQHCPWLGDAAAKIGDAQVRNLGTTLGNVCWGDPRANMSVALLASGAAAEVYLPGQEAVLERIALDDVFLAFQETKLQQCLAYQLCVPVANTSQGVYLEFSRQPQDLAVVNVCVVKTAHELRIALGGIASIPLRVQSLEQQATTLDQAADIAALLDQEERCVPPVDSFGSREFKLGVAAELTLRALRIVQN